MMSPTVQSRGIDWMNREDRLRLIEEIWHSLSAASQLEMPESHREEIDRRLAAADADPSAGSPWEAVRVRLRTQRLP
jgi:putative addiction module component (TIGR02574 family)